MKRRSIYTKKRADRKDQYSPAAVHSRFAPLFVREEASFFVPTTSRNRRGWPLILADLKR